MRAGFVGSSSLVLLSSLAGCSPGGMITTDTDGGTGGSTGAMTSTTNPVTTDPTTGDPTGGSTSDTGGPAECGNGQVEAGEECDNGADNADDKACTSECKANVCGDGKVGPGEGCDDGNQVDDDECNNMCAPATCGDGVVAPTEQCDDGNADDTDDCTSACTNATCSDGFIQPGVGEACDDGVDNAADAACTPDCQANACGDGYAWTSNGEECDDGPDNGPGKLCNAECKLGVCGDGDLGPGEQCDDGNLDAADGCSPTCVLEECGNKLPDPGEGCDDGKNGDQDDGCTDACQAPACGDGFVQASLMEQCDQGGNNSDSGACTLACKSATCGDGLVQANVEQCDDGQGNNGPGKACNAMCKANICGDGDKSPSEACDDGNKSKAARNLRRRREFRVVAPGCLRVAEGVGVGQGGDGLRRELALLEVDVVRHGRRHPGVARERLEGVGAHAHVGEQGQHAVADPVRAEDGQVRALLRAPHPHPERALEHVLRLPVRDAVGAELAIGDEHEVPAGPERTQGFRESGRQRDHPIFPLRRVLQDALTHTARDLHRAFAQADVLPHEPSAFADPERSIREQQVQHTLFIALRGRDEAFELITGVHLDLGLSLLRPGQSRQIKPLGQFSDAPRVFQRDAHRIADLARVVVRQTALLPHARTQRRQRPFVDGVESMRRQNIADVDPRGPVVELRAALEFGDIASFEFRPEVGERLDALVA